ncbi:MAG TPA: UDP-N-acetylmuramoyl-L-alanyl-D-glutamate--2,6-diaminopimelate ligase [Saprospiraceae bacterium]|nr:UDP-N-acetylmuramoyl-L-alanyl-D-glutamate--2,6-diaminopimelate ligase [Saprospiraceae bacterium]HMP25779.1 UDP-N-acetylmuramoyl-L-alanyl-D-glutamate--2,6-diaminopimelate ligase [Saprospiraceae bacterium]
MKNLQELLTQVSVVTIKGEPDRQVLHLTLDSRQAQQGSLFAALRGYQTDGHRFIDAAIANGASIVLAEVLPTTLHPNVTYVQVADSAAALGQMAHVFYNRPSEHLKLVGVTGTNGKTTTVTLLYNLLQALGYKVGLLSTVENRIGQQVVEATHTTPNAIAIHALLADMVAAGCDYAFMEVSSHAAHQRRIAGLQFAGGVFTNISHDHLDYHKTFDEYIKAKKSFFDILQKNAFALVNVDDKRGNVMVQNTRAAVHRYSLHRMADFRAKILDNSLLGLHLELDGHDFHGRLIGEFNAYNLLATYAAAVLLGLPPTEVLTALSNVQSAEGRFDYIFDQNRRILGIVDYAHTPDALEKVLATIRQLRQAKARVLTVVGCGGDRDRTKRPEMAKIACELSDQVILTSDNPRTEQPEAILADMEAGVPANATHRVLTIADRRQAIRTAYKLAQPGDIILVAGKGHEKYQEINGVKHPFDDKAILTEAFGQSHA